MKKAALIAGILLLAVAVAAGVAAYFVNARVNTAFKGYSAGEQFVDIPSGAGPNAIGERLVAGGVVRDPMTFRIALWLSGESQRLKAGEYRFDRPLTPREVIEKIARGEVHVVPITFREGLTIREMAAVFEESGFGEAGAFLSAARDASLIADIDPQATDLEGYLFPDTYSFARGTTAARVVRAMVDRFRQVLTPEMRGAAAARGLTVRQLVTLASLVEKETSLGEERPLVASVYTNRLRIGMGLQCDPTVIYALQLAGRYDGNIRRADLQFDSPYNTYRYRGLPPGPIAAPGQGSLAAAAQPAQSEFLYFVSRNDGSHQFSRTLAEHNRFVQRYQVEFFRRGVRPGSDRGRTGVRPQ